MWQKIKDACTWFWKGFARVWVCEELDSENARNFAVPKIAEIRQSSLTDDQIWTKIKEELKKLVNNA